MGLLPAGLLAETQLPHPEVYFTLKLSLADGDQRYGEANGSFGAAKPKVIAWGSPERSVSDISGQFAAAEMEVDLDDSDREWAKRVSGAHAHRLKGAPAVFEMHGRGGDSVVEFEGLLLNWAFNDMTVKLRLRTNDLALRRGFPKTTILPSDFPNAHKTAYALTLPLLYGRHSSTNYGSTGMLPTIYVDTVGFRYLVCAGYAKLVDAVYVDGAVQVSGYTIDYSVIGGRLYTLINFDADKGDAKVTCDAQGYETVGDGSGTLITRPSEVLKHLLVNFVYGDYQAGNWLAVGSTPIDTTSFAAALAFGEDLYLEASARYGGVEAEQTGLNAIGEICEQFPYRAFWKGNNKLAILPDDNRITDIYKADGPAWIRAHDERGRSFNLDNDDKNEMSSVAVSFVYGEAGNQYFEKLTVRDTAIGDGTITSPHSLALRRSRASN